MGSPFARLAVGLSWGLARARMVTVLSVFALDASGVPVAFADTVPAFVLKWGTFGTGQSQFHDPYGLAVDPQGNIYVADTRNHRIQKFSGDGVYLAMWTGPGRAVTLTPSDVAIDASGNVFVSDGAAKTVIRLDTSLNYIDEWSVQVNGDPKGVTQIAVDPGGQYVYATYFGLIIQYTTGGVFVRTWYSGEEPGSDVNWGIACGSSGSVYVVMNRPHVVKVFSAQGVFLRQWGDLGYGPGEFLAPLGIGVSQAEHVCVSDANHRVQLFTSTGVFEGQWGSQGTADGEFESPVDIAFDAEGSVYVLDLSNARVQKSSGGITPTSRETWGRLKARYRTNGAAN